MEERVADSSSHLYHIEAKAFFFHGYLAHCARVEIKHVPNSCPGSPGTLQLVGQTLEHVKEAGDPKPRILLAHSVVKQ